MDTLYTLRDHDAASISSLPRYSVLGPVPEEGSDEHVLLPESQLPRYSTINPLTSSQRYTSVLDHSTDSANSSSSAPSVRKVEHTFSLWNGKKAWATLSVQSNASTSRNAPKFHGGDDIAGSVFLELENTQHIQALKISVRGRVITSGMEEGVSIFLDESAILWSRDMGDPNIGEAGSQVKRFDGRLNGQYSWPFSFKFPTEVSLSANGFGAVHHTFQTPQTFLDRNSNVTIRYDLVLQINRGRLRPDHKIQTPIIYVPKIIPAPPSMARQIAYEENMPLPGPSSDPDGWFTLHSAVVHGELYDKRPVTVECSLSLANPLCYTRGTVISCSLSIRSIDSQVLDLLASPKAPKASLRRRLKYFKGSALQAAKGQSVSVAQHDVEDAELATAMWWLPSKDVLLRGDERRVEGEIHLPTDLQPSSIFPHFVVEYSVHILPFASPAFTPAIQRPTLASQLVTIATLSAPGPAPRFYTHRRSPAARKSTFEEVPIFTGHVLTS